MKCVVVFTTKVFEPAYPETPLRELEHVFHFEVDEERLAPGMAAKLVAEHMKFERYQFGGRRFGGDGPDATVKHVGVVRVYREITNFEVGELSWS